MTHRQLRATVSGSFQRAMSTVQSTVYALTDIGVEVLSPADPRVVDELGAFLFVASDRLRDVRLVQERHLQAIRASDFLWLVAPDGYIGLSGSMEIGYAHACGTPVFSMERPRDLTLRQFVRVVDNITLAIAEARRINVTVERPSLLVDPLTAIDGEHRRLEKLQHLLLGNRSAARLEEEGAKDNLLRLP